MNHLGSASPHTLGSQVSVITGERREPHGLVGRVTPLRHSPWLAPEQCRTGTRVEGPQTRAAGSSHLGSNLGPGTGLGASWLTRGYGWLPSCGSQGRAQAAPWSLGSGWSLTEASTLASTAGHGVAAASVPWALQERSRSCALLVSSVCPSPRTTTADLASISCSVGSW